MNKKVLIVDDNEQISVLLQEVLSMKDINSVTAKSSKEGLQKYIDEKFDLVICDYSLDEDYNGVQLIEEMLKNYKASFILTSGYGETTDKETNERLNIKGFLSKPFVFDELFKLVENTN